MDPWVFTDHTQKHTYSGEVSRLQWGKHLPNGKEKPHTNYTG